MRLNGVRVLDFGWVWAGAVPGQMLSFLGAEVIKVETRKRLDYMRVGRPIVGTEPDPEQQPMFHNVNRGKRSFTVDFRSDAGRELILELVRHCDVAIENFAPGVLERAGLHYEALAERRPDLVMLSLSGGGQEGPLRDLRSYASTIAAYSGLDSLAGYPGETPIGIQQAYPDPNASLHGAFALLAALYRRARTGAGEHIDMSQLEAGLATVGEAMVAVDLRGGEDPPLLGNDGYGGEAFQACVRCAGEDAWLTVHAEDDEDLRRLAGFLGVAAPVPGGGTEPVAQALARWCERHEHIEAMEALQAAGIAAGAVTNAGDRFHNRHYRERSTYLETEHPVIGWEMVYREPWLWWGETAPVGRAPLMGEDNEYVIRQLLGRSAEEYAQLVESGVLQ
jgi:benzylsuccinate CoA-transferase BbsF subunit